MLQAIQEIIDASKERNEPRITWDEYFMSTALIISTRSPCHRLQVGCVLVKDNRVISTGYNGFIAGGKHESIVRDDHEVATIHAEQNAIIDAAKRGASTDQCTAYITHYPCLNCTKSLITCGVKKIKYMHDYKNDQIAGQLFCQACVEVCQVDVV